MELWKSNFSKWLSRYSQHYGKQVNIQDIDYIIHDYNEGWYITIEEKTRGASGNDRKSFGQIRVQDFISRALTRGSIKKEVWPNRYDPEYRGHYVIVFSGTSPDDSEWISINGTTYTDFADFHELMQTGYLPQF